MAELCPHCGQTMPNQAITSEAEVLHRMAAREDSQIYRGDKTNRWYITYGLGEVHPETVRKLVAAGEIRPTYSNTDDSFTTGLTIDVERTLAVRQRARAAKVRRKPGQAPITVYVGEKAAP